MSLKGIIRTSHDWLANVLFNGAVAVDATAGNGHDTVFLAKRVGKNGEVFAFDIQDEALSHTRKKLEAADMNKRVHLINDSHAKATMYLPDNIHGAIFNLGYLPGGNKTIITSSESTIIAIDIIAKRLVPKGIIALVVYPGHAGGSDEAQAIEAHLKTYSSKYWKVMTYQQLNAKVTSPYLIGLEKLKPDPAV